MKFQHIRPLDAVFWVLPSVALLAGAVVLTAWTVSGYSSANGHEFEACIITWLVALLYSSGAVFVVWSHAQFLAGFDYTSRDGILVRTNGVREDILESIIGDRLDRFEFQGVPARELIESEPVFIVISDTVEIGQRSGAKQPRVHGYVTAHGRIAHADSVDVVGHELGHIILGRYLGNWEEERHHDWMLEHGLL